VNLIVWGIDYTPSIECADCGETLVADPNGNAPLEFTIDELIEAIATHQHTQSKGNNT